MATEKLSEGIRNFAKDTRTLENFLLKNFTIRHTSSTKIL
jgi:hypothetical protein